MCPFTFVVVSFCVVVRILVISISSMAVLISVSPTLILPWGNVVVLFLLAFPQCGFVLGLLVYYIPTFIFVSV